MVAADAVELGEEVLLHAEVLDHRLDDEVALRQRAEVRDRVHPGERRVAVGLGELALLDLPAERLLHAGDHAVGRALAPGSAAPPRTRAPPRVSAMPDPMIPDPTIPTRLIDMACHVTGR